jgi:hypothetical protein
MSDPEDLERTIWRDRKPDILPGRTPPPKPRRALPKDNDSQMSPAQTQRQKAVARQASADAIATNLVVLSERMTGAGYAAKLASAGDRKDFDRRIEHAVGDFRQQLQATQSVAVVTDVGYSAIADELDRVRYDGVFHLATDIADVTGAPAAGVEQLVVLLDELERAFHANDNKPGSDKDKNKPVANHPDSKTAVNDLVIANAGVVTEQLRLLSAQPDLEHRRQILSRAGAFVDELLLAFKHRTKQLSGRERAAMRRVTDELRALPAQPTRDTQQSVDGLRATFGVIEGWP